MNTRKYKKLNQPKSNTKSKTLKKRHHTKPPTPETKTIPPKKSLYASKTHKGDKILEHAEKQEEKTHDHCLKDNITWLSNFTVAKIYKNESNHLYKWKVNKPTELVKTTPKNEAFFEQVFRNATHQLKPFLKSSSKVHKEHKEHKEHKYFKMTPNEKALYEFKFVFGYLTLEEQYEFLSLLNEVRKNVQNEVQNEVRKNVQNEVKNINQTALTAAITYYRIQKLSSKILNSNTSTPKQKYNRISFYELDKHVVNNLCKALQTTSQPTHPNLQKIEGIYQSYKLKSFWYPSFLKYSKNLEEYILFNPQHELSYVGEIE